MKTAKIKLNFDYEEVKKVRILNYMAQLHIGTSPEGRVEIEAELNTYDDKAELELEDNFHVSCEDHEVKIELDDIDEIKDSFLGSVKSKVQILLPPKVEVKVETDNMPLTLNGLEGDLQVSNENGAIIINNCHGDKKLENENGPVKMHSCNGNVELELENGAFSAEALQGDTISVESENGPIKIRSSCFNKVEIENENGVIFYETLPVEEGEFSFTSENGVVHLVLPEEFDFQLDANTEFGTLKCGFEAEISRDEDNTFHVRKGEGRTKITVKTENGVIKLSSDGHMNLSFLKMKLSQLKESINSSSTLEDKEQVLKVMNGVLAAMEKALGSIDEQKIRESINLAMEKIRAAVENLDVGEAKDKVVQSIDKVGSEVFDSLKDFVRKVKEPHEHRHHQPFPPHPPHPPHGHRAGIGMSFDVDGLKEYIHKVIDSDLVKPYLGKGLRGREKSEVDERSRIKILEMLESGKITAEEAERLLKAIGKE
jgi:DUF4097 and DUF4098 domain-containing protein YvlB